MRKGFEGIRELADLENPRSSSNAIGSLLGDVSKLSQGVCVKKTNEGEVYVFDETIDSDGKKYVKVAIKKVDNNGIATYEELSYTYVEPHQAWYYNSYDGLAKGLRAARIWEGEHDPILGYCLRYARGYASTTTFTPPPEYIVKDRMPAETPVCVDLEVLSNTKIYDSPRGNKVVASLSIGEVVQRTSCIVYTYPIKYPIKILHSLRSYKKNNGGSSPAGPFLQEGKYVYLLTYTGEGTYLGWYEGEEAWWLEGGGIANLTDAKPKQPWGEYVGNSAPRNLSIEVWYYVQKKDGNAGWVMVAKNGEYFPKTLRVWRNISAHKPIQNTSLSNSIIQNQNQTPSSSTGSFIRNHPFLVCMACLFILGFIFSNNDSNPTTPKNKSKVSVSTSSNTNASNANVPIEPIAKRNVVTGYDSSKPILNDSGLCELTIDNSRNDMPVYVRVWDMDSYLPVRAFYIAQGDKFTTYGLTRGIYEVRYIELYDNDFPANGAKSELFELQQIESAYGVQYSQMSLTLYKVRSGNTTTTSIPANQI